MNFLYGILKHINFLTLLTGQTLPVHHDVPLFTSLDKSKSPVWLQVALALSKLRYDEEVRQIQFVGYINGDKNDHKKGGEFVFWPEGATGAKHEVAADPNSAVIVDGVHVAHGVSEWHPKGILKTPPENGKDDNLHLEFDEQKNKWIVFRNGKPSDTYAEEELRMSIGTCHQTDYLLF